MTDYQAALESFEPRHEFFAGIDSDGCTFDTMELKQKECFIPAIIEHYGLQNVSKFARETAEFINLYSEWRGINRFLALLMTMDMLRERPEVVRRGVEFRDMRPLQAFADSGVPLGNPTLQAEVEAHGDPELAHALRWSESVNSAVQSMVHGVRPFPHVRECLQQINTFCDAMCVSATPVPTLTHEWKEHDIAQYVSLIAGQEVGSKRDTLARAARAGYGKDRILMIGDAPGDMKAARANDALFFPIVPGHEEESWERLHVEALTRFQQGTYAGAYEDTLVREFLQVLPSMPPWQS